MFEFRPPTEEEIAAAKEEHKQAYTKGNLNYETLRSYNPLGICGKCGKDHIDKPMKTRFAMEGRYPEEQGEHEVLLVVCRRCNYVELQKCIDSAQR